MGTIIDLHLHTSYSSCSNFDLENFIGKIKTLSLPVITVTDHGSCKACDDLAKKLPEVVMIWGIEVTTQEGDFLIYSEDLDYIHSLGIYLKTVTDIRRDEQTAVIWAHPRVPQVHGWQSPSPENPEIEVVLNNVDALEIFNGTMINLATQGVVRMAYFNNLNHIAHTHNIAITGGSDAHDADHYRLCWTEFDDEIKSANDFIRAIKQRRVHPGYNREHFKFDVDLTPDREEES